MTIRFAEEGHVAGNASGNSFMSGYTQKGNGLCGHCHYDDGLPDGADGSGARVSGDSWSGHAF